MALRMTLRIGSLFSGYGGLDLGIEAALDSRTVWVSDIEPGPVKILAHRFPDAPNLGDITRIDWSAAPPVDIIAGGFPCQDLSNAGTRTGLAGKRSGLWSYMRDAIDALKPRLVVAENVRGLLSADAHSVVEPCPWCVGDTSTSNLRALGAVLSDLADIGYDARWIGLRASDVGACHPRFRVILVAYPRGQVGDLGAGLRTGDEAWKRWRLAARGGGPNGQVTMLPTPTGQDAANDGGPSQHHRNTPPLNAVVKLLPTPAVNDMGAGKTLEYWDEWAPRQMSADGRPAPHGASLAIEALRGLKDYAPTLDRWAAVIGRPAPPMTEPTGRDGGPQLSPAFTEWMMGLPAGWITETPGLTRNAALKACGNGVVPLQAAAALTHLLGGTL